MDEIDPPEIARVNSVGWVLRVTKESIVLAPHLGFHDGNDEVTDTQAQGVMAIPLRCVVKKRVLPISF